MPLNVRIVRVSQDDWACAAVCNVFSTLLYRKLVQGLDGLEWSVAVQDFYQQREVNLCGNAYYDELFNKQARISIASSIGSFFGVQLGVDFDVAAHKMIAGDYIGIHTDANDYGETHRLTVTLNEDWSVDDGGVLLALNGGDLSNVRDAWLPTANNGFLFEISETSYHAVSPVLGPRPRYSLILTFKCSGREVPKRPTWMPFPLEGDVENATSTASHMAISAPTFRAPYQFFEFGTVNELRDFVDNQLDNAPSLWSYRQGASTNVDQHGHQPKGTDEDRVKAVMGLRRIPPVLVVRRKSGRFSLVDGSHRLSHANDEAMSIGVAVFDEK
jgi:hypothetical protein